VYLSDAIVIMTSNVGSEHFRDVVVEALDVAAA
jgi:ATP-dependent Clp protease ATP-binding subunit ClpA